LARQSRRKILADPSYGIPRAGRNKRGFDLCGISAAGRNKRVFELRSQKSREK
jgi:hypothetical protein